MIRNKNVFFSFLNQIICCRYSKEPSRYDGSFERPKHMIKPMGKKIFTNLCSKILFIKTNVFQTRWKYSGVQLNICSRCNKQPTFSDKNFGKIRIIISGDKNSTRLLIITSEI